ncbi:hypothetical protein [Carnimonas bestiolae]|uniref:hypothetical protein n=1 Tax=Carnimonas bestiolae TaxID=3402172 RepID=UPI003EDBEDE0
MIANERGMALPLALLLMMLLAVLLEGAAAHLHHEVANVNREFSALQNSIALTQSVEAAWQALERGAPVASFSDGETCVAVTTLTAPTVCPWLPLRHCQALEVAAWRCDGRPYGEKVFKGGWRVSNGNAFIAMVPGYWRWG